MRVALVNPRSAGSNRHALVTRLLAGRLSRVVRFVEDDVELVPPLSLLQVAGALPRDWELTLVDEEAGAGAGWLSERFDLALVTAMIAQAARAYALADALRARGVRTVAGGFHPSALPDEALAHFDHVVAGEGEGPLARLLADLAAGRPERLYRSDGAFPIDRLPPPRYDLVTRPRDYAMFPLLFSRGCPHDCSFCSVTALYGHRLRHRPVEHVLRDIAAIRRLAPRPYLSFADENLLADRRAARELAEALVPLGVRYECHADLSFGDDPRLVDLLARSGLTRVQVGFESIEPESLRSVGRFKRSTLETFAPRLDAIQSAGIRVLGMFMIGLDGDTEESLERLAAFLAATDFHQVDVSILTPIPGTRAYDELKREGRLLRDGDWAACTWQRAVFRPKHVAPERLAWWADRILERFYLPENQRRRRARFKAFARRRIGGRP